MGNGLTGNRTPARLEIDLTLEDRAGILTPTARRYEVVVSLPAGADGSVLLELVGRAWGRSVGWVLVERTGQRISADCPDALGGLLRGDVLIIEGEPAVGSERFVVEPVADAAHGSSGWTRTADQTVVLGRAESDRTLGLGHPTVSRRHARIDATSSGVRVEDLGSTNGTAVAGQPVVGSTVVCPGDVVDLGDLAVTIELDGVASRSLTGAHLNPGAGGGIVEVNRAPRVLHPDPADTIQISDPPDTPPRRRFPIGAAIAPLIIGGLMAWLFNPLFAIFVAASPLMIAFSFIDDRVSGRSAFRREAERWQQGLVEVAEEAARVGATAAAWRRRRVPAQRQLARWARTGAPELWQRRPDDQDFLVVAPGDADQASRCVVGLPQRGDAELLHQAATMSAEYSIDRAVPVEVDLTDTPMVGICGDNPVAAAVARALVVQVATMQSPRDVRLTVIAPAHRDDWQWTTWLPHVATADVRSVAGTEAEAAALVDFLTTTVAARRQAANGQAGPTRPLPHHVVVVHPPFDVPAHQLMALYDQLRGSGVSVIHIAQDWEDLPGQTDVLIEAVAEERVSVTFTKSGRRVVGARPRLTDLDHARRTGQELAPFVDVTTGAITGAVPAVVGLAPLLAETDSVAEIGSVAAVAADVGFAAQPTGGPSDPALVDVIAARWSEQRGDLAAPIGQSPSGPLVVDLRRDGPHALIAGTTGAGKSELLQSLVASLAIHHSPERLNLILIDYKGGAAFRDCVDLPHTVGFVTDLDDRLAERALVSLRAELRRRERILADAGAKDLVTMEQMTDDAPPALVIVIDELAALKSEVPDFVDGLIDVAQRGRSMGVHLVLSTQKPAGVITGQIDANTNLRIALRMADDSESTDVIGTPAAAQLANDRPGRALLKVGAGTDGIVEFQSMFIGGRSLSVIPTEEVAIAERRYGSTAPPLVAPAFDSTAPSDLAAVVLASRTLWDGSGRGQPFEPWQPPLPATVSLEELVSFGSAASAPGPAELAGPAGQLRVPIGLADQPDRQTQVRYELDLSAHGNVALFGTSGSGKTTALHTMAVALATTPGTEDTVVYGIDAASGDLAPLEALPNVGQIVSGQDLDRVLMLLAMLRREIDQRRGGGAGPRIVLMVDGFGSLWAQLEEVSFGQACDQLVQLLADGRSVGIHTVMTADQRAAIPLSCTGSIGLRMIQRLASPDDYSYLGFHPAPDPDGLPPGRALLLEGPEVQLAIPGPPGSEGGAEVMRAIGEELSAQGRIRPAQALPQLSENMPIENLPDSSGLERVPIGWDRHLGPAELDLITNPALLIVGPRRSGRSTALATIASQLVPLIHDRRLLAPRSRSAAAGHVGLWSSIDSGDIIDGLEKLADEIEDRTATPGVAPMLVAIDDVDELFDAPGLDATLDRIVRKGQDANVSLLVTATTFEASHSYASWLRSIRSGGSGLVLRPAGDADTDLFGARFPRDVVGAVPAGRGLLVTGSVPALIQLASPSANPSGFDPESAESAESGPRIVTSLRRTVAAELQ